MRVMRHGIAAAISAAVLSFGGVGTASAALIDFTDHSIYSTMTASEAIGASGGIHFRVTGVPTGELTYNGGGDAPGPVGPLAGDGDGIGIKDDESGPDEYLILEFFEDAALTIAADVRLVGAHFLDLFIAAAGDDHEFVNIYDGTPPSAASLIEGPIDAVQSLGSGPGYKFAGGFSHTSSIFSFDSGEGNDSAGVQDFALAAVEIEPVPLPAGALLLGTAMIGFGVARRRRKDA